MVLWYWYCFKAWKPSAFSKTRLPVRYNLPLRQFTMPPMTVAPVPASLLDALSLAHASWRPILLRGLDAVMAADPAYLPALAAGDYLPTQGRLFAAFALPLAQVRYVLVGEGPYPRADSATGVCFMDGAVGSLWSAAGLSKPVNRATSLRNFMKMLLVADGQLHADATSGAALAPVAAAAQQAGSGVIQTLPDLQRKMTEQGFLLLNAALVFRHHVPPAQDARGWLPFLQVVLEALARQEGALPQLVLWGKIAEQVKRLPVAARLPQVTAEHPYNLSFIGNNAMQALFGPMQLLRV